MCRPDTSSASSTYEYFHHSDDMNRPDDMVWPSSGAEAQDHGTRMSLPMDPHVDR